MNTHLCLLSVTGLLLLAISSVRADGFLIVPGKQIGSVTLGMSEKAVRQTLGTPQQKRVLAGGIVQESWKQPLSIKAQRKAATQGTFWKDHYVVVYFENDTVVQAEVNSPRFMTASRLSTGRSAKTARKEFVTYSIKSETHSNTSPGGIPATKHFLRYEDATIQGIAWRYGAWSNLSPELTPDSLLEAIIVHQPNHPVITDPDGGLRFVQTSRP